MKFPLVLIVVFSMLAMGTPQADEEELPTLQVLTMGIPPYSGVEEGSALSEGSKVVGLATDIVNAYLTEHGLHYTIHVTKWSAAYERARQRPLTLIYPIDRVPAREDDFIWLKPLIKQNYFIYVRNDPKLNNLTLEELLAGDYIANCSKNTIQCRLLETLGFPENRIVKSDRLTLPIRHDILTKGQADLTIFDDKVYNALAIKYNLHKNDLKKMFKVGETTSYIAGSKNLDPKIIKALEQ